MTTEFAAEKAQAAAWFETLRDEIVAAFEQLEITQVDGPTAELPAGRFEQTPTTRTADDGSDAGGGLMSVMPYVIMVAYGCAALWGLTTYKGKITIRQFAIEMCVLQATQRSKCDLRSPQS